ncbi:DUF1800 family protein [Akkermansiaceae bacterium]|nr:DUF1800 family protein [Akkermansiaceae bacterium]MDA7907364.1 DUF1800 family protein [Akkermansiaceae bacterium]MDA7933818.1 DUF1800 family protein [Akkermansiaceae bacterium]MDB4464970.1 DUF1800 family protein [Akkermansiaceae bacterium]
MKSLLYLLLAETFPAHAKFTPIIQVGTNNNSTSEFSRENGTEDTAPGSATIRDDHYYLAGTYPAPVGTLLDDEDVDDYERSLTSSDPRNVIHFHLKPAQATNTGLMRIELDFIWSGASVNGNDAPFENVVAVSVNGNSASFTSEVFQNYVVISAEFPTTGLKLSPGANTLEIRRIGNTPGTWLAMDQISASLDPIALVDADGDKLPLYWETQYQLSDSDPFDTAADFDGDTLTNLAEFLVGTNPRLSDTDADGLNDQDETESDPLDPDSDDDGLLDGAETNSSPVLVDTDADGASDAWEIQTGYNPDDDQSTPPQWAGAIGINFRSERRRNAGRWPSTFPNGLIPQINWNQTELLESSGVSSGSPLRPGDSSQISDPVAGIIVDSAGNPTSATASFTFDGAGTSRANDTPAAHLLNGYLSSDSSTPATLQIDNIPASFVTYDVYVYLSTSYLGPLATLRRDGIFSESALMRPLGTGGDLDFILFRPSTGPVAPRANVVRYQGLTGRSILFESFRTSDNSSGIAGIQIIDTSGDIDSDGLPDWWEILHRSDVTIGDDPDGDSLNWLAEFNAGSNPWKVDTDGDGLNDAAEAAVGSDPNFGDTDDDGLSDFDEVLHPLPSDPTLADTDSDGVDDASERANFSDPGDEDLATLPVPIFVSDTEILWEATDLQFVNDHGDGIRSDNGTNRDFIAWRVDNLTADVSSTLRIMLPRRNGKIVFNVSTSGQGSFLRDGRSFSHNDYNTDLTSALGFVGFGSCDTSDPLTFRVRALSDGTASSNWTVTFSIINQKSGILVAGREFTGCNAVPSVADQSAVWGDNDVPGASEMLLGQGIKLYRTSIPVAQLNGLAHCADLDNDGMNDLYESTHGLNPNDPSDALLDGDADGLSNLSEAILGTDPTDFDSDDDGVSDSLEAAQFSDPNSADSIPPLFSSPAHVGTDLNENGMSDLWEAHFGAGGLTPTEDEDGDGFTNQEEAGLGSDPFDPSSNFHITTKESETPNSIDLCFPRLLLKSQQIYSSNSLQNFNPSSLSMRVEGGEYRVTAPFSFSQDFFRVAVSDRDLDSDGLSDWDESILGSESSDSNSLGRAVAFDGDDDGIPDGMIPGDQAVYLERFANRTSLAAGTGSVRPTRTEASRLLMQGSFGPTMSEIETVRQLGIEGWIDDQIENKPATHQEDYIQEIENDLNGPRVDHTYRTNNDKRVEDENLQSAFARAAISGPDQLRQRVAFALSQILVISRQDGNIDQNVRSLARYYDRLVDHAFGNYYDLLMGVTLDPNMGRYLSHVGNLPPDPAINRFPDENYAREVMQLFSIGLWQLNQDGTRKLDQEGNPIPTYDNDTITELARVMTGLWFANNGWGSQTRQDQEHLVPMELFPENHDFDEKTLLNGFVIPARTPNIENGMQDIRDAIRHLFEHPNCAPFVCRSLIQFLVTSNPKPAYVARISAVFADNGTGERGDLGAVVKAILMDAEARDPAIATSPNFGIFREPVVRTMHLAKLTRMNRSGKLVWWDYGNYFEDTLQMPLNAPTVFNFYRPDYTPPGSLDRAGLDGPAFEIANSYTMVSLPNRFWNIADRGFRVSGRYQFTPDYGNFMPYLEDSDVLLDYLNVVVCAGNMGAKTRSIIKTNLANTAISDPVEKLRLAVYLAIMSPEGAVQR